MSKKPSRGQDRVVFYRAPCGRMLRDEDEVDKYLHLTDSLLTIDLFCFDPTLKTDQEFISKKVS